MTFQPQQLAAILFQAVEQAFETHGLDSCAAVLQDPRVITPIAEKIHSGLELFSSVSIRTHSMLHLSGAFDAGLATDTPLNFIPVPADGGAVRGALAASMLNHLLGLETISYGSENAGHPFVNLVPQVGKGRKVRKSHGGMRGHTDGVTFPFPGTRDETFYRMAPAPDWVGLACLRNPHGVATRVIPMAPLIEQLTPELLTALREPQFVIGAQGTFKEGMLDILGSEHIVDGGALLHGARDFVLRFSHSNVDVAHDASAHAKPALDALEKYCAANSEGVVLNPGDLLWVNNRRAIHGRAEVGAAAGEKERWLLRTYGIRPALLEVDQRYVERPFQLYP
ncbi:TauD/TfdA family dioxygenase [Variovorax sp. GB1R11]|uniref:TauD/TfdA family dioxygenase n=1 Tax=Variovorax sp. GB1R11 TaxID=3443741 RepID=UPI003F47E59C